MAGPIPTRPARPNLERLSIAVVASLYNYDFVQGLIDAARDEWDQIAPNATVTVYRVPGAFEVPVCAELILRSSKPDAVVGFGVILRGATDHADLVGASVTDALQRMAVTHCVPVVHEVLLLDNEEQAEERCLGTRINRGTEAARVAINMISLFSTMRAKFSGAAAPQA
ncbi:MAG: 6,7-dimethyl-8-ribityllumazine synthase [Verrucomicrobiales bacterium]|nr:6,7-dimethyl-8-ribityllumazine synthase [Verrucomicrobiales bacterium]